jgi:Thioesterase-like superfamily
MHKSNSTFFTDLDIARIDLIACLFSGGLAVLSKKGAEGPDKAKKSVMPILGGVHCSFAREIAPYARYEMWTRVLCWDQKWLYLVTYFVRPSSGQSRSTVGEPADANGMPGALLKNRGTEQLVSRDVLSTAITKYVLKAGCVTVPPERLLEASGLLSGKPRAGESSKEGGSRVRVEEEPVKGLKFAEAFGSLDGLHSTFSRDGVAEKKP